MNCFYVLLYNYMNEIYIYLNECACAYSNVYFQSILFYIVFEGRREKMKQFLKITDLNIEHRMKWKQQLQLKRKGLRERHKKGKERDWNGRRS